MSLLQIKKELKEIKETATKKPNSWPQKRSKEELDALLHKYVDAGLWDEE